ncbi:MAG TPA: MBL fold metallo-hydrolase [Candidatus Wallbacteria bacterium]|nr:MBL fold metallo-hydrolase [Candidatus Wallbacteria bacterium]
MKIKFIGAIKSVTGSCFLLTFNVNGASRNALIDCGMYQGAKEDELLNYSEFPFDARAIDYVFLTHVHIDHSGLIPKLVKNGFNGKIISTRATFDLSDIMLRDSARIQQTETERYNRRRLRLGKEPKEPIYTEEDAKNALKFFEPVDYNRPYEAYPGITATFHDAGHVLGSAFVKFDITENGEKYKIVFSGDVGNMPVPILKDPEAINDADYIVMESTYGDRIRNNDKDRSDELARIINETITAGGKVIIPSFAVGRTQELIYEMHGMLDGKKIPSVPIYIDSPLACNATEIFRKHMECFDAEMVEYLKRSDDPFNFSNIFYASEAQESRAINQVNSPQIIISSSGMANNGRILHHLKYNIFKKECTVLFVGYQAFGTIGRQITDGEKLINIMGEKYSVNARVESIHGYSAHADQSGLLKWLATSAAKPRNVFLVHGETEAKNTLQAKLSENGYSSIVPSLLDEFEIKSATSFVKMDFKAAPEFRTADFEAKPQKAAETVKPETEIDYTKKPLNKIVPVSMPFIPPDNILEKISKKELIKLFKEFRSQLQSMESRIDNFISRISKR